jgi:hypothetical protein
VIPNFGEMAKAAARDLVVARQRLGRIEQYQRMQLLMMIAFAEDNLEAMIPHIRGGMQAMADAEARERGE